MKEKNEAEAFYFSSFLKVIRILHENRYKELSVNEILRSENVSRESFFRVLNFLKKRGLVDKISPKEYRSRRGKGRIIIYFLSSKGELFYNSCLKPFIAEKKEDNP